MHVRPRTADGDAAALDVEPEDLSGTFAAPDWLRDLGVMAWLLVGVAGLLVGAIWLLGLMNTIVTPVVTAGILTAVLSPLVARLARRMPRGAAAGIVFVTLLLVAIGVIVLVLAGIVSHTKALQGNLQSAVDKIQSRLQDAGVEQRYRGERRRRRELAV